MDEFVLMKKVYMECPLCDKMHEVEERMRKTTMTMKEEEVSYEERFYFCANADEDENEFETVAMTNANLLNARNAYRRKMGLLTSTEIVELRENYGLSQVDLARLLGWGEATIARYESKEIQDEAYDTMLRLIKDNPLKALEFLTRQALEGEYVGFDEPSDANGYTTLDIDKVEAMVSYLAEAMSNLYKVKLMKSLWYADVLCYQQTGKAMTGLVYRHDTMGALPVGHYSLMNLENLNVQEEMSFSCDSMLHVYPSKNADYSMLSEKEKEILDTVIHKFKDYKTSEIVEYMHEEKAYQETRKGEIISFELAGKIRALQ